jgi:hypothetical protein
LVSRRFGHSCVSDVASGQAPLESPAASQLISLSREVADPFAHEPAILDVAGRTLISATCTASCSI